MKMIITLAVITLSLGTVSAKSIDKSDLVLRSCLTKVYSNTTLEQKEINSQAKECRDQVKEMKKVERVSKKKIKLQERIAKLQKQLSEVK